MANRDPGSATAYDVVIVGGGPAGLAAALWLARYRRRIRVHDAGEPRNRVAWAVHGYPGLPEIPPDELRRRIADQARAAGAELRNGSVVAIEGEKDAFRVDTDGGDRLLARRILLAYGRRDEVPPIPGLAEAYGITIHHCPDCDAPRIDGVPVGVIGWDRTAAGLALFLLTWTDRVTLLSHGRAPVIESETRETLARHRIEIREDRIARVLQDEGLVSGAQLDSGATIAVSRIFFCIGSVPCSDLGSRLGCAVRYNGDLETDHGQQTSTPGVYAAGDITGHPYIAIAAAAGGVRAALAIHRSLLPPEFELRDHGSA